MRLVGKANFDQRCIFSEASWYFIDLSSPKRVHFSGEHNCLDFCLCGACSPDIPQWRTIAHRLRVARWQSWTEQWQSTRCHDLSHFMMDSGKQGQKSDNMTICSIPPDTSDKVDIWSGVHPAWQGKKGKARPVTWSLYKLALADSTGYISTVSLTYSSVYFFAYLAAEENSLRLFYMCTFFGCRYDVALSN